MNPKQTQRVADILEKLGVTAFAAAVGKGLLTDPTSPWLALIMGACGMVLLAVSVLITEEAS